MPPVIWPAALDRQFAELEAITGLSVAQWQDILTEEPQDQAEIITGWKALDTIGWTERPDRLAQVVAILEAIGTAAGIVGNVEGAVSAVNALRGL